MMKKPSTVGFAACGRNAWLASPLTAEAFSAADWDPPAAVSALPSPWSAKTTPRRDPDFENEGAQAAFEADWTIAPDEEGPT